MKYPEGRLAQVTSSVIHYGEQQAVKFQESMRRFPCRGKFMLLLPKEMVFGSESGAGTENSGVLRFLPELQYEKHPGEIQNFLEAVERGERPFITGEDGRLTIEADHCDL